MMVPHMVWQGLQLGGLVLLATGVLLGVQQQADASTEVKATVSIAVVLVLAFKVKAHCPHYFIEMYIRLIQFLNRRVSDLPYMRCSTGAHWRLLSDGRFLLTNHKAARYAAAASGSC